MGRYILSLDQGTSSSRAIIFNEKYEVVSSVQTEFSQFYTSDGLVEQDAVEVWNSQFRAAKSAIEKSGLKPGQISAIGITNQRETTVVWDKRTGKPVTSDYCAGLKERGFENMIREKTGLVIDAYFSASKLNWILNNVELPETQYLAFGTIDSWLLYNLTQGKVHATDYTNASRTMLFNIHEGHYDKELLELFAIDERMLPSVLPSSGYFGTTTLFGGEIDIMGIAGDQQAALIGHGCVKEGMAKNTYGTGCFTLMNTGGTAVTSSNGLLTTIAYNVGQKSVYALEGSVFNAGSSIQWLRDELGLISSAKESEEYAQNVQSSGGVFVVPAFSGLGAPYWDMYARGTIVGITRGTNKYHIVRATLEAIAYQTCDVLKAMQNDSGVPLKNLEVDGGACANNFLMQFQSDILGCPVLRPKNIEITVLGAAFLAGMGIGMTNLDELHTFNKVQKEFLPRFGSREAAELLKTWARAVDRSIHWVN